MLPLSNLHVLVTRPEPQGTDLCLRITDLGGKATNFPTIAFAPPPDAAAFQQAINQLAQQDWLIFISPQSVYASVVPIRTRWPELPSSVKFAAIGAGTAKALQHAGYNVDIMPAKEWNSESLLALPEFLAAHGKKIAVIRGEGGREKIDQVLAARGAEVLLVIAYQRILPEVDSKPVLELLQTHSIHVAVCTSFEGVRNLKLLLGASGWPYLNNLPILVMSERIKMLAEDLGFQTIWVTPSASNDAILTSLIKIRESHD